MERLSRISRSGHPNDKWSILNCIRHENDQTLADIDKRLEELQTELLKLASAKADYEDIADELR